MRFLLVGLIRGYQLFISPYFPASCRYYPSCSQYAVDALKIHGALKGSGLAVWRLLRCHPWSSGGEDAVPGLNKTCTCEDHGSSPPIKAAGMQQPASFTSSNNLN